MKKLLVVCGPTATGKTALGITLAKKFNGEIISADSRQVYRGMDIGTGKDIPKKSKIKNQNEKLQFKSQKFTVGYRKKERVPVWLVDIVDPDYRFNVGEYQKLVNLVIRDIWIRGKLPIVVGGTGLYIKAITQPLNKITIPPNREVRERLEKLNLTQLQEELQEVAGQKWGEMNESDRQNPRRLIRAIEIATHTVQLFKQMNQKGQQNFIHTDVLVIGLTAPKTVLLRWINERVEERVKQGIVKEIMTLISQGYHWGLPSMSVLGYRDWREYFDMTNDQLPVAGEKRHNVKEKVIQKWKLHERQYAKRQLTWFKKMAEIHWFDVTIPDYQREIVTTIGRWYNE